MAPSRPQRATGRARRPSSAARRAPRAPFIALLAAAAAACGGEPRGGDKVGVRSGGTIVIAGPADLDRANPLVTADAWTQEVNRFLLFTTLLRYGPALELQPYLARAWTMHGDTGVTFALRDDVFWHDGRRTTAHDVRFTFERALDPATAYPNAAYLAPYTGVEVIDSFTVRFRFHPHADPLAIAALLPIAPAHLLAEVPAAELHNAAFNKAPVGNGPFRFVSRQANDRWIFEADPSFPATLGGRPLVDRLVWRVVSERSAQVAELLTGNAHVILSPPAEEFGALRQRPQLRGLVRPSMKYSFIGWNAKRRPFGDARVRRALTMAIDRARILELLRSGYGQLATGPVHPNHWAHDRSLAALPWDTAAARALLAQGGVIDRDGDGVAELPDGSEFEFELKFQAASAFTQRTAELIEADLRHIGARVRLRPVDWNTLVGDISSADRDFDAVLMGWEADFRLDLHDLFHSAAVEGPFQLASYRNPSLDALLDRVSTVVDRDASLPLWHQVQRILRDDQPWSFLYYYPDLILVSAHTAGIQMDIRGVLANASGWRMLPEEVLARR